MSHMAISRFKYFFPIPLNLFLIKFIDIFKFKFSGHHIAATARMLSLFSDCHYKFSVFFSFFAIKLLQFPVFFFYFCNEVPLIL